MPIRSALLVATLCGAAATAAAQEVRIAPQDSGVDVRLRGISAVDAQVAWASGRGGTVLRTIDGGAHWQDVSVPGAGELDFRDVEAFDAQTAVVLSIGPGEASRVYRTDDGGAHWMLVLQNRDPRAFFDCMAFDGAHGRMLGDPVDGRFQVHATGNGGRDWRLLADGPAAVEGEAAFAASGTCIARAGDAWLAATGGARSRLHAQAGEGAWRAVDSGMGRGKPEAGVFSLAIAGDRVFAVGGDYKAETAPGNAAGWRMADAAVSALPPPRGYRSGAACVSGAATCIAVGPSGVDAWSGEAWSPVSDTGYDAIDLAGTVGWASGDAGRIARVEVTAGEAAEAED
jgi:photosystem II stability/assembly factor-like uncharacterized protein